MSDFSVAVLSAEWLTKAEEQRGELLLSDEASAQLSKSARRLFLSSNRTRIYLIAVYCLDRARIFCFDRGGFIATEEINWLSATEHIPRFFWRLYNPGSASVDDTITIPPDSVKQRLWAAVQAHKFYGSHKDLQDEAAFMKHCVGILAARRRPGQQYQQDVVQRLTVGPPLWINHGLFGRATRVYRVVVEADLDTDAGVPLTFYALKDAWRESRRRPEVDLYDLIEHHCTKNQIDMEKLGMARCHGSLDLSDPDSTLGAVPWDTQRHVTMFGQDEAHQCHHTRTLLTPLGCSIEVFPRTKNLVTALYNSAKQLIIAWQAGVTHRHVSDGNIMFFEDPSLANVLGFLCDYDCAEFTEEGVDAFNMFIKQHPHPARRPASWEETKKSLKSFTGTFEFMAVEILEAQNPNLKDHPCHELRHDLESTYWLLVSIVLRNTKHSHSLRQHACQHVLGQSGTSGKLEWFQDDIETTVPAGSPLSRLLFVLGEHVYSQVKKRSAYDKQKDNPNTRRVPIDHEKFMADFAECLAASGWAEDDAPLESRPVLPGGWQAPVSERESRSRSESWSVPGAAADNNSKRRRLDLQ
ncbi:hypothetical protein FB45DRAFT_867675 [Roridomyces roridus]|uniref:Fungal-type protein kinase domain-containing protein n=1 Tax=Roridomyces roridus TaxID=1738132 RepID=A0AAD7BRT1_9AGAR|nr:hypothetical protein FB45DRAFT_867675 [Roridomyces roridus]